MYDGLYRCACVGETTHDSQARCVQCTVFLTQDERVLWLSDLPIRSKACSSWHFCQGLEGQHLDVYTSCICVDHAALEPS